MMRRSTYDYGVLRRSQMDEVLQSARRLNSVLIRAVSHAQLCHGLVLLSTRVLEYW